MAWVRVTLWLGSWVGAALCLHRAATADASYFLPGLFLAFMAVAPVLREVWLRPSERTGLGVSPHGLRWSAVIEGGSNDRALRWEEVVQVDLVTPGRDQPVSGLHFVLETTHGGSPIRIPAEEAHQAGLYAALEAYLGPIDDAAMLAGLAARGPGRHVLWRRRMAEPLEGPAAPLAGRWVGSAR